MRHLTSSLATVVASLLTVQAHASLILHTGVTSDFNGDTQSTMPSLNDLLGAPFSLYFGQLGATAAGTVDFYYVGNEAGYTNSLLLNSWSSAADVTHSTAGLADVFSGGLLIGSADVLANSLLDFGFCTSGGADTGEFDRCVWNTSAASLIEQFNYGGATGYRSIGYRPIFDSQWANDIGGEYTTWGLFFDDSGASNDDDHDDYVAIAHFRASPVSVPEPATSLLLGAGLLGLALTRRRSRQS